MSEKKQVTYTITLENPDGGNFEYVIKPIDMGVYYGMQRLLKNNKTFEAYVMMISTLKVEGDDPNVLLSDAKYLPCLFALDGILAEMLQPVEATIKKN
jgi:hypothetical protein